MITCRLNDLQRAKTDVDAAAHLTSADRSSLDSMITTTTNGLTA
jgi:hypothetical protein